MNHLVHEITDQIVDAIKSCKIVQECTKKCVSGKIVNCLNNMG